MSSQILATGLALGALFLSAAAGAAEPASGAPSDLSCQSHITEFIKGAPRSDVPRACWRIGPLVLGMTEQDLDRTMGSPEQTAALSGGSSAQGTYIARLYAFPRHWRAELTSYPQADMDLRFVEVVLFQGHVVKIANDPGARIGGPSCGGAKHPADVRVEGEPAGFRQFQTFAGIRTGMTVRDLSQRFGSAPNANASKDWRSYLRAPLSLDVDPGSGRINGFAIGTDANAVTMGTMADLTVSRDPRTCRIANVAFGGGDSR